MVLCADKFICRVAGSYRMAQPSPCDRTKPVLGRLFQGLAAVMIAATNSVTFQPIQAEAATRTEKTFGSWAVVCVEPDKGAKACSMTQSQMRINQQTGERRLVLRLAISEKKDQEQTQIFFVPTGVLIKEGVRVALGDAKPIILPYTFCGPRVCVASTSIDAKGIRALQSSKTASVTYVLGSKKQAQVQVDLNGFGDAYKFLIQELG